MLIYFNMHVIRTFYSPEDAYTALSLLVAHGFKAQLLDSATLSVLPLDSVALGGYRLAVLEHEAEASLAFLEEHQPEINAQAPQEYFGDEASHTYKARTKPMRSMAKWLLIAMLVLLLYAFIAGVGGAIGLDWIF